MTVIEPACNLMSYHAEIVCDGDVSRLMQEFLGAVAQWDVFCLANVVVDGPTAKAIAQMAEQMRAPVQVIAGGSSPFLAIQGEWREFLATKGKKFRYKLRRRRDTVEKLAGAELEWYVGTDGIDELLDRMLTIEGRSWKARDGVDIPSNPKELDYHRRLLPFLAESGMLIANVLSMGGRPVAYNLCCHHGQWVGQLKTSFDENYAEISPGSFVVDVAIQKAFEIGAREFDFLGEADPHKLAWSTTTRAHASYFLFAPRLKPIAVGFLKGLKSRFKSLRSVLHRN